MNKIDAVDAISQMMHEKSLSRSDVFPVKSRASEIMNRKRPLTLKLIRRLHFEFGIPAEILILPFRSEADQGEQKVMVSKKEPAG